MEHFRFCQKYGNDKNSREREEGGHVFCVITTQCVPKPICDSPLVKEFDIEISLYKKQ